MSRYAPAAAVPVAESIGATPRHSPATWLGVQTDAETGCQYLMRERGGLTPRIAPDGRTHMGCRATPATPAARPAAML